MSMLSDFEEKTLPPNAIKEVDAMVSRLIELRTEKDGLNKELKAIAEDIDQLEESILSRLNEAELSSFAGSVASVSVVNRFSVRVPNDMPKKLQFFKFLQARGIFNELVGVNSATLNSFYKQEMEAAQGRGEFDFKVPGIDEPSHSQNLSVRRK